MAWGGPFTLTVAGDRVANRTRLDTYRGGPPGVAPCRLCGHQPVPRAANAPPGIILNRGDPGRRGGTCWAGTSPGLSAQAGCRTGDGLRRDAYRGWPCVGGGTSAFAFFWTAWLLLSQRSPAVLRMVRPAPRRRNPEACSWPAQIHVPAGVRSARGHRGGMARQGCWGGCCGPRCIPHHPPCPGPRGGTGRPLVGCGARAAPGAPGRGPGQVPQRDGEREESGVAPRPVELRRLGARSHIRPVC